MVNVPLAVVECRAEFAVGSFILIIRCLIRIKTLNTRSWYWDDWLSILVFLWHTALFAIVEFITAVGAPPSFTEEHYEVLSPQMRVQLTKSAKAIYASFFLLINFKWSAKGVIIVFVMQLTRRTRMVRYMVFVVGFSVACLVAAYVATFFHCLPIKRNWEISPDLGSECAAGVAQNIVIAIGNVATDALLIFVVIQTLWGLQISLYQKINIMLLLSLGLFATAMTIGRCIVSVYSGPTVAQSFAWVFREALVTIFAISAPVIAALFRRETGAGTKPRSIALNNMRSIGNLRNPGEFNISSNESMGYLDGGRISRSDQSGTLCQSARRLPLPVYPSRTSLSFSSASLNPR